MFHRKLSGVAGGGAHDSPGRQGCRRPTGSLLWTHFGVSGPVVMDASRVWTLARERGDQAEIYLNVLPGRTFEQANTGSSCRRRRVRASVVTRAVVPERFAEAVCAALVAIHSGHYKCREANGTGCLRLGPGWRFR